MQPSFVHSKKPIKTEPPNRSVATKPSQTPCPNLSLLIAQLDQVVKDSDKSALRAHLPDLVRIVRECGRLLDLDVQKKMHEIIYAHEQGFEVMPSQHGVDMRDPKTGRAIEHKKVKVNDLDKTAQCNINIHLPHWPAELSYAKYAKLAYSDVLKKGDLDVSAVVDSNDKYNYCVTIPKEFLAQYVKRFYKQKRTKKYNNKVNLGGPACQTCHRIHRLDCLVKDSQRLEQLTEHDWHEIFIRRIKSQSGCLYP